MNITRQQKITMAALLAAGAIASTLVLWPQAAVTAPTPTQPNNTAHADEARDHDDDTERRIQLTDAQRRAAGISVVVAGPGTLRSQHDFNGEIKFNEDRTAHVVPRLAGIVASVSAALGQHVRSGQLLAVINSTALSELRSELLTAQRRQEAAHTTFERERKLWQDKISAEQDYIQAQTNLREANIAVDNARQKLAALGATSTSTGLNRFEIRAPFDGTLVEKHLALGETVKEDASIFTLSDLRTVWAEFAVAPKDLAVIRVGQKVVVSSSAFKEQVQGTISYVGALIGEQTRTAHARVTLDNPQGAWRPGLFVTVRALGAPLPAELVVASEALQRIDGREVLFKAVPGGFEAIPVKSGRADGQFVEILSGLKAGDAIATTQAYILTSELGKASAEHTH